ncbi:restriction endonuclease [Halopseudomonas sp. SMJS2]|uniref:restriction endonuclease n=1 Tax=Halopseudomonas sp. SMJS2 TaxID=3041098 RepID=UPI002452A158|nr:restriction endonuclease [Halopseudomonas sp. SMJS2]WGK61055.1 restriction endonuclease [Halopseudomonas sp. SMJS2]
MNLAETDLIVDHIYGGSRNGNASDDPLPQLLGVDNGAGFRHLGKRPGIDTLKLLALKSNFNDPDWPDHLDTESGLFTYYGDNKTVRGIHDTPRQGNQILRNLFDARHSSISFDHFPVILLFGGTGQYRDVRFLGLAVPGAQNLGPDDDLVAIWRAKGPDNARFQNYKSVFTILDVPVIARQWLDDVKIGKAVSSAHAPKPWLEWLSGRKYSPLYAPHSIDIRSREQQLPQSVEDQKILTLVHNRYSKDPFAFEAAAVEIARLFMPNIGPCETTRPWRDGGRDAVGAYRIGTGRSAIEVEFALEAKCYAPNGKGVGVKELSRLLSRLRHRQFGILVTTSYLASQAYTELKEDKHPVVIIAGGDIVSTLKERVGSLELVTKWLNSL